MRHTRGMVRHEAKRDRRRKHLPERSLIVGLDIGKRRHAAWMIDASMRPIGRSKVAATQLESLRCCIAQNGRG